MTTKETLGAAAVVIGFAGYVPYLLSVWKNKTKPHAFSWIIWSFLSFIAFFAQMSRHAGSGAWPTGGNGCLCLSVAICGLVRGEKNITRGDWASFIAALAAIPIWYLTKNPLWAVLWIVAIDVLAFYPTVRKSWHRPWQENIWPYVGDATEFTIALFALESYSAVTIPTPLFIVIANSLFVVMVMWRRAVLARITK